MNLLKDHLEEKNNNFNLIRMLASIAVIFSHSFILANGPLDGADPLVQYLGYPISGLAVNIFFITSGLLVTKSLIERKSFTFFIVARTLRIFPALIVAVLFSALAVGLMATELRPIDYLLHPDTFNFIRRNIWLFDNIIQYTLPGVFSDTPYKNAVNGSLWTLPWEIYSYFSIFVLFFIFRMYYKMVFVMTSIVFFLLYANGFYKFFDFELLNPVYLKLLIMFYTGVLFYLFKDRIRISFLYLGVILGLYFIIKDLVIARVMFPFVIAYSTLSFAYLIKGIILNYNKLGDFSYGTYIFAFPIQQLIVFYFAPGDWELFFYSTVITILLAAVSWYFIEKPSMNIRNTGLIHFNNIKGKYFD